MATDRVFYEWAKQWPTGVLALAGLNTSLAYEFEAFTTKKIELEGRFDGVLTPKSKDAPMLFLEFQAYADDEFLADWQLKILARRNEKKLEGPMLAVAVYLKRSHVRSGKLEYGSAGSLMMGFYPCSIVLEKFSEAQLLGMDEPGVLPLLPLCGIKASAIEGRLPEWAHLVRESSLDEKEAATGLGLLALFASHRLPRLDPWKILEKIGGLVMESSRLGQALLEKGLEKGRAEGEQNILRRQAKKRFKTLPAWLEGWMQGQEPSKLELAAEELLDAEDEQDWKKKLEHL